MAALLAMLRASNEMGEEHVLLVRVVAVGKKPGDLSGMLIGITPKLPRQSKGVKIVANHNC